MGAMENKSLNIFNDRYILADPETATDGDYAAIEGVVGHEYFHNWTGDRITCRDWFQLSLKEGLTVFRDQEFSADLRSRPVERIDAVRGLRVGQFPEDAGPLAHPVRPDSYIAIDNFYTATVYQKGAEVIRMMHTLLGEAGFQKGMKLYVERHDGAGGNVRRLRRARWPMPTASISISSSSGTARPARPRFRWRGATTPRPGPTISSVAQRCPPTPGQPDKKPMHIPLAMGLLDAQGRGIPLRLEGEAAAASAPTSRVLELKRAARNLPLRRRARAQGGVARPRLLGADHRQGQAEQRGTRLPDGA